MTSIDLLPGLARAHPPNRVALDPARPLKPKVQASEFPITSAVTCLPHASPLRAPTIKTQDGYKSSRIQFVPSGYTHKAFRCPKESTEISAFERQQEKLVKSSTSQLGSFLANVQ
jgi:hypothetical protein